MQNYMDVFALYVRVVAEIAPETTFDRDELLEILDRVRAMFPDEAAVQRFFDQLRHPLLKTAGHA
jgi:hypothetical protein